MTTTDTAPLSARLRERIILLNSNGAEMLMQEAADALDALYVVGRAGMDVADENMSLADHWKARAAKAEDDSARRNELLMEALNELATTRGERDAAEARATQAEAERDALNGRLAAVREDYAAVMAAIGAESIADVPAMVANLQAALSASQAREAGMREALEPFAAAATQVPEWVGDGATTYGWIKEKAVTAGDFRRAAAALSPAQPAQDADQLVTAYDNGVDHAWGVAQPLAEAAEGVINWCDFAMSQPGEFDQHGVRNLTGPASTSCARPWRLSAPPAS